VLGMDIECAPVSSLEYTYDNLYVYLLMCREFKNKVIKEIFISVSDFVFKKAQHSAN
jgi:hypothetical protein